ncbi:MAG: cytochrome c [Bryobacteraceae bacterium]
MKKFLFGFLVALLLIAAFVLVYFGMGFAPAAATAQPIPFEKLLAGMALHSRIAREMPSQAPIQPDEANMMAGARIYRVQCAVCHGLPGQPEPAMAKGMFPHVPQLFRGHGVTDDPAGETYWKVANGIRLTGMPAFNAVLNDSQMWQVSLLAANADKASPAVKATLSEPLTLK